MQSFYRRSSVDNRLDTLTIWECPGGPTKKQTKSQLPSLEHLLEKPGLSYHGAWNLQKHCWTSPTHLKTPFSMIECSLLSRDLKPTRISYSRTKIPATLCLPLDPEGMFWRLKPKHHLFHVNLMGAALLRIGHIEIKIWENLVCHLVFYSPPAR